jgi:spermidine/putrescine transport system permease protein
MAASKEFDPRPWYLLAPSMLAITALVVIPMSFILVYSFYENLDLAIDRVTFQFGNWQELLTNRYYHTAIWKTLRLSLIVTVLAAILGYIPAYFIAMTKYRHKWLLLLLLILPFWVSFIIRTLSWIHILGNQGAINGILMWLGLIDAPIRMMFNEPDFERRLIHYRT